MTQLFYRLFFHLEHLGLLDPLNEVHLYPLHYVYLPWINHVLLDLQRSGLVALDFAEQVSDSYGVEEELPSDSSALNIPKSQFLMWFQILG